MERVNQILKHKLYKEYVRKIKALEENRIFCRHNMEHFLDVCRLAEIEWLNFCISHMEKSVEHCFHVGGKCEEKVEIDRELIYAAGLLHDIGRWQEYENGMEHEKASALLAPEILKSCDFTQTEIREIVYAIANHRNKEMKEVNSLAGFLYRGDKKSRACFCCQAESKCDWSSSKKNMEIK